MRDFSIRLTFPGDKLFDLYGPADITKETTEAIVNAANSTLAGGGGVDGAIHAAGGPAILQECRRIVAKIRTLQPGKAVITTAGRMPSKFVVHTVGPIYSGHLSDPVLLKSCYRESIRLADEHAIQSMAFPAISIGAYGYPAADAAALVIPEALASLASAQHVAHIRFVMFNARELGIYAQALNALLESNAISPQKVERVEA